MTDVGLVIRTESLGGSPLSRAARDGKLPQWYSALPADYHAWRSHSESVIANAGPEWLDRLRGAIVPTGRAASRLERSAGGKGLVITTGQQAGLFGGPLMILIKALTARALADELQDRIGIPVAPLFWAATDDADFDEAAAVSVALPGGARELRLEQRTPPGTPMSRVPLDGDIDALAATLRDACGSAPHATYIDATLRAFRDGNTIGDAYVALLRQILEPLEIAVMDASHPCVADTAQPVLRRAAANAVSVGAAVHARTESIIAAGFRPQVEEVAALSLVFLNADGVKRRLTVREAADLGNLPRAQYLSSTVLVRPIVERAILPTAAYVGGPAEVAYFAQVSAVAEATGLACPLIVPRWSATVIEPHVGRSLRELGFAVEDLADPHAAEGALAKHAMPASVGRAVLNLRAHIAEDIAALRGANHALLPDAVFQGLERSIEHRIARTERRLQAGVKRREAESMRKLATLRGNLFPHGVRQERKLAFAPFLARHGVEMLEAMLVHAREHARTLIDQNATVLSKDAVPIAP